MIDNLIINENIIRPIQTSKIVCKDKTETTIDVLMTQILQPNFVSKTTDIEEIMQGIIYGDTVLFAEGCTEALVMNTKGFSLRSISEPESEKILRGPREGFNEGIIMNLSMIRRKIRSTDLKMKFMDFGTRTKTKVCILYVEGIAKQSLIDELYKRLEKINIDGVLDANYIIEMIKDSHYSPFKTMGETERPDVVAAKLLEGRIAIVVDGTPCVITLPYLFIESFQNAEDYYVNFYYATFTTFLRFLAFFITISVPALYIALVNYQPEMLPTPLLLSITAARNGVPFPTFLEAVGMILVFQILAEAGIRMPAGIGQTLSIVGALVIGQAAVQAKIISAPMIIVVAITGIAGLILPKLTAALLMLRFILLFAASFLGLYGFACIFMSLLIYLLNLKSFNVPYMTDIVTLNFQEIKDTAVRAPWSAMKTRPKDIAQDKVRMK